MHMERKEPKQMAFSIADRYISIQVCEDGYDYSILDEEYRIIDGGVYDDLEVSIWQALDEIVKDLKEPAHRSRLEGRIHIGDELIPHDYDALMERNADAERIKIKRTLPEN